MSLTGKIALITGSSRGIGAAIAHTLASKGATIILTYSTNTPSATTVLSSLPNPSQHTLIQADLSLVSECQRLISETISKHGRIDILILNAGFMTSTTLSTTTEEIYNRCYNINVRGPFFTVQSAAPFMPEDGSGRVIFLSSSLTGASTLTPNYTVYVSTKGAVEQMMRGLSKELGARNIAVNAVAPGPTATDLFLEGKEEAVVEMMKRMSPKGRIGQPEDVAGVVGFLCEEEAGWVMGQVLRVNGGFV